MTFLKWKSNDTEHLDISPGSTH